MVNWGGPLHKAFWSDTIHVVQIENVENLAIKANVMKFPQLIHFEESCMWVEVHNDSKELVGSLKEVVIFASWALKVILLGSINARMMLGRRLSQTTQIDSSILVKHNLAIAYIWWRRGDSIGPITFSTSNNSR